MNIENNNPIQASSYTIDPAAVPNTEEYAKKQGEPKTGGSPSLISGNDSISISDDARAERDKKIIEELEKIDRQVQQHEAAHQAAAGEYFRGISFTYKVGPDGKRYAVAGEVQIDTSASSLNPKAAIAKMQRIRRAALAPSDPSPQDLAVAAQAAKAEANAKAQEQGAYLATQTSKGSVPEDPSKATDNSAQPDTQVSTGKSSALAPGLQVSMLFNTPGNLLSPQKRTIDITL
ncbi:MAG: hypothetical protein HF314_13910 [Ignavibacteria bacterium]|jgi:hypothetical protein|nr:hypothetical protein [Ignavibacteria bacterium]MCU7504174.1 hypothetical protein [Ignavibacteria bacterium]MCU7516376.1 hypothetical protein [Ignavibacteria bacterium]